MKSNLFKDLFNKAVKEIQSLVTISYLLAVGIGMLFNFFKYKKFGINIFDYAGIFDFLIAPFADYRILLFTVATIVITYMLYQLDEYWQRKYPESYKRFSFNMDRYENYRKIKGSFTFIIFIFYLFIAADIYGRLTKRLIVEEDAITLRFTDNEKVVGKLIGKTNDVIFLSTYSGVKIVPIASNIKEIRLK